MIEFSPELYVWSAATYWFIVINAIASAVFTLVVIVFGFADLRYLFRALREDAVDTTDDGRVVRPSGESGGGPSE